MAGKRGMSNAKFLGGQAVTQLLLVGDALIRHQAKDLAVTKCLVRAHWIRGGRPLYFYTLQRILMSNVFHGYSQGVALGGRAAAGWGSCKIRSTGAMGTGFFVRGMYPIIAPLSPSETPPNFRAATTMRHKRWPNSSFACCISRCR